ncbi:MAG: hypothetical protein ABI085_19425 [Gemmatimonadaceae bacterium]
MVDQPEDSDVEQRVKEIQDRHRGRVNWHVSKHTAELAIEAIEPTARRSRKKSASGKSRRRKKHKRLL